MLSDILRRISCRDAERRKVAGPLSQDRLVNPRGARGRRSTLHPPLLASSRRCGRAMLVTFVVTLPPSELSPTEDAMSGLPPCPVPPVSCHVSDRLGVIVRQLLLRIGPAFRRVPAASSLRTKRLEFPSFINRSSRNRRKTRSELLLSHTLFPIRKYAPCSGPITLHTWS
jgi:hypothetical protein